MKEKKTGRKPDKQENTDSLPEMPGDTYIFGIKAIAERRGVSLKKAAIIASRDCRDKKAGEHLKSLRDALRWLTSSRKDNQSQGEQ